MRLSRHEIRRDGLKYIKTGPLQKPHPVSCVTAFTNIPGPLYVGITVIFASFATPFNYAACTLKAKWIHDCNFSCSFLVFYLSFEDSRPFPCLYQKPVSIVGHQKKDITSQKHFPLLNEVAASLAIPKLPDIARTAVQIRQFSLSGRAVGFRVLPRLVGGRAGGFRRCAVHKVGRVEDKITRAPDDR